MKKEAVVFLKHILESINLIEEYIDGLTEEEFHTSALAAGNYGFSRGYLQISLRKDKLAMIKYGLPGMGLH